MEPLKYTAPIALLSSEAFSKFREGALRSPLHEVLGMIFYPRTAPEKAVWHEHENLATDRNSFYSGGSVAVRRAYQLKLQGHHVVFCHSHPKGKSKDFSNRYISMLHQWRAAGLMLHGDRFDRHKYYHPQGIARLEGRPWRPVEANCYTLVRDALMQWFEFDLDAEVMATCNIDEPDIFGLMAELKPVRFYRLAAQAMDKVGNRSAWSIPGVIQRGDVLSFAPSREYPCHLGIMGELSEGRFLHHRAWQNSYWEIFNEEWRSNLNGVYRIPGGTGPVYQSMLSGRIGGKVPA